MKATVLLLVVMAAWLGANAHAQITIPSDVGVTFTATPTTNLTTGEPIDAVLTVTNYGPDALSDLVLTSSAFVDEIIPLSVNLDECYMYASVADGSVAYYFLNWPVATTGATPPFLAGETMTCHFQLALTSFAPQTMPFSFGVNPYFTDPNPSNDNETVIFQRAAPVAAAAVPALSPAMLVLLLILLIGTARGRLRLLGATIRPERIHLGLFFSKF